MAISSAAYLPALRNVRNQQALTKHYSGSSRATPAERILGALFPNRGTGWPGGWSQDRLEQVLHMRNWTYVALDAICTKVASLTANQAYVMDQKTAKSVKACERGLMNLRGTGFGGSSMMTHGGHSWLTMGEVRSKALSVVKPHEELEPLESDHQLRRLEENPNPYDVPYDYKYEKTMYLGLTGLAYEWKFPNKWGVPCEKWVIPSHWVWPRTGGRIPDGGLGRRYNGRLTEPEYDNGQEVGDWVRYGAQYLRPDHPDADRLIQYYEIRPWGGMGSAGVLRLPPHEVIMTRYKSPINKIDGYSKLAAAAQWIDEEESISKSRWSQSMNTARPELWVELGAGYEDPNDDRIARYEAKFMSKFIGEYNYGKPIFTPAGAKLTPLSFSPTEMAYYESENQIRDMILSTFRVPKTVVGVAEDMTYGSLLASLATMCAYCLNPILTLYGQTDTKYLASGWDGQRRYNPYGGYDYQDEDQLQNQLSRAWSSGDGSRGGRTIVRRVRMWYDDCVPADPQQVNQDLAQDQSCYAVTPNEVRALRGRKPYGHGGDDPLVSGPGGIMPLPLNTGEEADLAKLAEMIKPMMQAEAEERGKGPEEMAEGGEGDQGGQEAPTGEGGGPPSLLAGDLEGNQQEDMAEAGAGIKEPNGPPSKKGWEDYTISRPYKQGDHWYCNVEDERGRIVYTADSGEGGIATDAEWNARDWINSRPSKHLITLAKAFLEARKQQE